MEDVEKQCTLEVHDGTRYSPVLCRPYAPVILLVIWPFVDLMLDARSLHPDVNGYELGRTWATGIQGLGFWEGYEVPALQPAACQSDRRTLIKKGSPDTFDYIRTDTTSTQVVLCKW